MRFLYLPFLFRRKKLKKQQVIYPFFVRQSIDIPGL